jgi:hypothetical protein
VLCSRTRDSCRLGLVVLPPATPPADPPAGAFGPPAANGSATDVVQPPKSMPPIMLAPAPSPAAANPPAPQQAQAPVQQQQPISEIVSLEAANALCAGAGAVVFVHPDLAQLEALAQRLEKDDTSALHGASKYFFPDSHPVRMWCST